jgi:hypothetical protein
MYEPQVLCTKTEFVSHDQNISLYICVVWPNFGQYDTKFEFRVNRPKGFFGSYKNWLYDTKFMFRVNPPYNKL